MLNRIFAFVLCLLGLQACSKQQQAPDLSAAASKVSASAVAHLSPGQFLKEMETLPDGQLLDVRTAREVAAGHIPGAINIDVKASGFAEKAEQLDKDKAVFVYCASGRRSKRACKALQQAGFTKIYELDKGFKSWSAAGLQVER